MMISFGFSFRSRAVEAEYGNATLGGGCTLGLPGAVGDLSFNKLWMVWGRWPLTDRGHGSIWPAASDPGLLGLERPHHPDQAGLAPASSSCSTSRRAAARSLRSARESPFRSRE